MNQSSRRFNLFINIALSTVLFGAVHAHYYAIWVEKQTVILAGVII